MIFLNEMVDKIDGKQWQVRLWNSGIYSIINRIIR